MLFGGYSKPVNNFFFFSSLKQRETHGKINLASDTLTLARDRKIQTTLRTNQIARFVNVPSWKKLIESILLKDILQQPQLQCSQGCLFLSLGRQTPLRHRKPAIVEMWPFINDCVDIKQELMLMIVMQSYWCVVCIIHQDKRKYNHVP